MTIIRNILALIGLLTLMGTGFVYLQLNAVASQPDDIDLVAEKTVLDQFDPKAKAVYTTFWKKLKEFGNAADATALKYPLADGVSPEDAEEAMKLVANEHNMKLVGELFPSQQVKVETGKEQRFLKIYQFCNPQVAMKMLDYSDAFSAYLPCRIAMVQDKAGNYNLYALDMDMMIYGGKALPPELLAEVTKVQTIMTDIMKRGAAGDF
ncbi:DUF302 domain-containing protein [Thiofilum flexile]|uniref:DUF302 domain-containing protein n=1 Tax=Thiofilum flexile TaxID=125627 RepID=UPI000378F2D2|nr:DUF302 domain-containing protein [Thiofilum flexile]